MTPPCAKLGDLRHVWLLGPPFSALLALPALPKSWLMPVAIAGALSLVAFVVVHARSNRLAQRRARELERRQQQAILRLLDEITRLANGDLTADMTVSEDFTGALADSINYTVQTLRGLVATMNRSAENLVAATAGTQARAAAASAASRRQAEDIHAAAQAIAASSAALQAVATRAEGIAEAARESVSTAHLGADTVGRTIQHMASLREQVQDTGKRIKRLGESSQEIGNIVELINGIAEETGTLALNASIQAAAAGEAGRGFAGVAQEVQRLAERAAAATRDIETHVRTIRADTSEAVISMERSTANVVAGARSAEEAGQSLARIEAASQDLARAIETIAAQARTQAAEADRTAATMQAVRGVSVQASQSAEQTAAALIALAALADRLRSAVAGFKLPAAPGAEVPAAGP